MLKVTKNFKSLIKLIFSSRVALLIFLEVILGIILSSFSFFIFIKLRGEVFEKELLLFDETIMRFFYLHRTPLLTILMRVISFLGYELIIILGILLVGFFLLKKHKREAMLLAFILTMAPIINAFLKKIIQRPRPFFHPLVNVYDYSFPSGHAMSSLVFYATISYFVYHATHNKRLGVISTTLSTLLIILIGISRIYLGVHYPTDVLAGYLGGLFWFSSVMLINKTLIFFKLFRKAA